MIPDISNILINNVEIHFVLYLLWYTSISQIAYSIVLTLIEINLLSMTFYLHGCIIGASAIPVSIIIYISTILGTLLSKISSTHVSDSWFLQISINLAYK